MLENQIYTNDLQYLIEHLWKWYKRCYCQTKMWQFYTRGMYHSLYSKYSHILAFPYELNIDRTWWIFEYRFEYEWQFSRNNRRHIGFLWNVYKQYSNIHQESFELAVISKMCLVLSRRIVFIRYQSDTAPQISVLNMTTFTR